VIRPGKGSKPTISMVTQKDKNVHLRVIPKNKDPIEKLLNKGKTAIEKSLKKWP
jgi:hypothetical protein